ncbi:TatD family hydrolase [Buchnera aphidicola]|uniref:Putative deoxyribonuclease, tatD family n=1 Tax=Buchnera aphidicola subsp. Cinara cedri (strain Cc) TaxID=372461 RepID=Q057L0_BUCCC|nr:TatD family hydrolase [Buchnera aphidicola]ABJ90689.1 putative deoxyribonuclease, tatD family [Buchnera aphidicola BCc]
MFLIDTHCHIHNICQLDKKMNLDKILKNAYKKNIRAFLSVSTSILDFYNLLKLTKNYNNIFLSCGLHPNYFHTNEDLKKLKKNINNNKVIAIGETGLDFFKSKQKKKNQIKLFEYHLHLSKKKKKPIIIHNRNSDKELLNILISKKEKLYSGIIHSFTGKKKFARKLLDLGFYISFSGIITFKKSEKLREILKFIPLNRLLIETDSPYLSPEPYRGKKNQPSFLYFIAKCIQKYIKIDFLKFIKILKKNFLRLFQLKNNIYFLQ